MPRIVFTPSGLVGQAEQGTTLLAAAREMGVDLDSVCGGRGICGRCQVTVEVGNFAKWAIDVDATSVSPFTETEARYLRLRGQGPGAMAVSEVRVMPLEWGATAADFFRAVAADAPRGAYPRAILGEVDTRPYRYDP